MVPRSGKTRSHPMFIVVVADKADAYTYGPFATRDQAEGWARDNESAFHRRLVHVTRAQPMSPVADEG